jgi:hypothetical protein
MKITYMEISTYNQGNRRADVLRTSGEDQNYWGCRYYLAGNSLGIEWYKGHSEEYAENAAENYVQGIKEYQV